MEDPAHSRLHPIIHSNTTRPTKSKFHLLNSHHLFRPKMPPHERAEKQAAAQQAVDILHEIATILVSHTPACGIDSGIG